MSYKKELAKSKGNLSKNGKKEEGT